MRVIRNNIFPFKKGLPRPLEGCALTIDPVRPWMGFLLHPIGIDAPRSADPLCCYIDTVIFYEHPKRHVPGLGWAEHGRAELPLQLDDVIETGIGEYVVQAGRVRWAGGWKMLWTVRRIPKGIAA